MREDKRCLSAARCLCFTVPDITLTDCSGKLFNLVDCSMQLEL